MHVSSAYRRYTCHKITSFCSSTQSVTHRSIFYAVFPNVRCHFVVLFCTSLRAGQPFVCRGASMWSEGEGTGGACYLAEVLVDDHQIWACRCRASHVSFSRTWVTRSDREFKVFLMQVQVKRLYDLLVYRLGSLVLGAYELAF